MFHLLEPSIWANYHNSQNWIVRPFGDDSPKKNHDSRVRENSEVVIIYPDILLVFNGKNGKNGYVDLQIPMGKTNVFYRHHRLSLFSPSHSHRTWCWRCPPRTAGRLNHPLLGNKNSKAIPKVWWNHGWIMVFFSRICHNHGWMFDAILFDIDDNDDNGV